jgi:hypothetical protein
VLAPGADPNLIALEFDEKNPADSLLWFADALRRVTIDPAEESIRRIRIQQTLNVSPLALHVVEAEEEIYATDWSDDGQRLVTGSWKLEGREAVSFQGLAMAPGGGAGCGRHSRGSSLVSVTLLITFLMYESSHEGAYSKGSRPRGDQTPWRSDSWVA